MPFCPRCSLDSRENFVTCPLDGQIMQERRCPECQLSVSKKDLYCGHCGYSLQAAPSRSVALVPISWLVFLVVFLADTLFYWVCANIALPGTPIEVWLLVFVAATGALFYLAILNSSGRQTFGQVIFRVQAYVWEQNRYPSFLEVLVGILSFGVRRDWKWYSLAPLPRPTVQTGKET